MQITFDTADARPAELSALARFIQDLAALQTAPPAVAETAKPGGYQPKMESLQQLAAEKAAAAAGGFASSAPHIETEKAEVIVPAPAGIVIPTFIAPADRPDTGTKPADDLNAAAVFGGQQISAAPAPSVPVVPTVPVAPSAAAGLASVTAPPTIAGGPPAGVELDSTGLPWDPRIHGSTKAKNTDGTWRQRRGLNDPDLKKRVEAELRATLALPASPTPPVAPTASAAPSTTEQYLAGTPRPPMPPAAPAAPGDPTTFGEFMGAASNLVKDGKLTSEAITTKLQGLGLASIIALNLRPDLIPAAWRALQS